MQRSEYLLPVVTVLIVAGAAVSPVLAQGQVVDIRLTPPAARTASGGGVNFTVQVEPNGQEVSGVDVCITFPATLLQVVDADTGASGVQIQADTDTFNVVLANTVDNSTGVIKYSAGRLTGGLPTAQFTLATISLRAASISDVTTVAFSTSASVCGATPTAAVFGGDNVLRGTFNSTVTMDSGVDATPTPTTMLPPVSSPTPTLGPTSPLPTATHVPTPTPTPSPVPTRPSQPFPTATPIATHTATPTPTATLPPVSRPTPILGPTSPLPTDTHVPTPTPTPTPPLRAPAPTPSPTPSPSPSPAPPRPSQPFPTATPIATPITMPAGTAVRTPVLTATPTMTAAPAQVAPAGKVSSAPRTPVPLVTTAIGETRSPSPAGTKSPSTGCAGQVGDGSVDVGLLLLLVSPMLLGSRFRRRE